MSDERVELSGRRLSQRVGGTTGQKPLLEQRALQSHTARTQTRASTKQAWRDAQRCERLTSTRSGT